MQIRTVATPAEIQAAADALFSGNIALDLEHKSTSRKGVDTYRAALRARDSCGPGARRSASGRRGPWACWHAFRDFFYGVYARDEDAVITTGIGKGTRYVGLAGFEATYPSTAYENIGSMVQPSYMPDNCDCRG